VTSVFRIDGYQNVVILRHGEYLTVYAGLDNIAVRKGDKVKTGQRLGHIYSDADDGERPVLHFELRREKQKLNPSEWVKP
jgi:septal ring factor EnvC (AmiA/AmiB activator)